MYVSERDKALIAALPPDVTVASILREALAGRRGCAHDLTVLRCVRCGATLEGHGDLESLDDDQAEPPDTDGAAPVLVGDMASGSPSDGDTMAIG